MGVCVILVPVSMTQINKHITLLLHLHEHCLLQKCWSVSHVSVWWEKQEFIGKLKLWSPLEGQEADSALWNSAFVSYSIECAIMRHTVQVLAAIFVTLYDILRLVRWRCDESLVNRSAKMQEETCHQLASSMDNGHSTGTTTHRTTSKRDEEEPVKLIAAREERATR